MNLNKSMMTHAALILIALVLWYVEWGSCLSDPPAKDGNSDNSVAQEIDPPEEWLKARQDIKFKTQLKNFGRSFSLSSDSSSTGKQNEVSQEDPSSRAKDKKEKLWYMGNKRLDRALSGRKSISSEENYETFKDLVESDGFIDKTNFTITFMEELHYATAILRPKRTGKSSVLKMLKEFFSKPRIDIDSYDPITRDHKNSTYTAKSTFVRTLVWDPAVRREVINGINTKVDSDTFIDDHMNKWPIIWVSMFSLQFSPPSPSLSKIEEKLSTEVVQETFKEHEDVLFIKMAEMACMIKYDDWSKDSYQKLMKDFGLDEFKEMESKITRIWLRFGESMDPRIQKFYRFYKGMPPYNDVGDSLKLLSRILHDFYGRKVIVLVDEHDAPVQKMYSKISLDRPEGNADIIKSINDYAATLADLLGNVSKENEKYTRKFLMCGISNSVINAPSSAFNILDKHNALDTRFAKFF
jgi:hypothetical protein